MKPLFLKVAVIIVLILVIILFALKKKSNKGNGGNGGNGGSCLKLGDKCTAHTDCCSNLGCSSSGVCEFVKSVDAIPSFFLETKYGYIEPEGNQLKETTDNPNWGSTPKSFWSWDGIGNLSILFPQMDANGKIVSVQTQSIQVPKGPDVYTSLGPKIKKGVILTKQGAIYSSDYSLCVSIDDTHTLVWKKCLDYPTLFIINQPSSCTNGKCSSSSECCAPYKSCIAGQCVTCFGDPETICPDPTTTAVCVNGVYTCVSNCKDSPRGDCSDNQESKCVRVGDKFEQQCEWKCQGNQPTYCTDGNAICSKGTIGTNGAEEYKWKCPDNPCNSLEHPPPDISTAPPPDSKHKYVDGHFENTSDPSAPWVIPVWLCEAGKWSYQNSCNLNYKQTCSTDKKAVCDNTTNFEWQCASHSDYPNLCGASATTGNCGVDARCFDISTCGGESNRSSDWTWVCPSSVGTSICQLFEINDWPYPGTVVGNDTVYFKDGTTPFYPTVRNDRCRDSTASYIAGAEIRTKINNPNVLIDGSASGNTYNLIQIPPTSQGAQTSSKIFTLYNTDNEEVNQWHCASDNPCQNGGAFEFTSTGGTDKGYIIPRSDSYFGPPTTTELLQHGKCVCPQGFAGITCQFSRETCSNNGYPEQCNTDGCNSEHYYCSCENGSTGPNCQYTDAQTCSANGKANADGSCSCSNILGGANCNSGKCVTKIKLNTSGNNLVLPFDNRQGFNVPTGFDPRFSAIGNGTGLWADWIYDQPNRTICLADPANLTNPLVIGGSNLCLTVASTNNKVQHNLDPYGCNSNQELSLLNIGNYNGGTNKDFQRWAITTNGELVDTNCPNINIPDNDLNPTSSGNTHRCAQVAHDGSAIYMNPLAETTNGECAKLWLMNTDNTSYSGCPVSSQYTAGAVTHAPVQTCTMGNNRFKENALVLSNEVYYDLEEAKQACMNNSDCTRLFRKQSDKFWKLARAYPDKACALGVCPTPRDGDEVWEKLCQNV